MNEPQTVETITWVVAPSTDTPLEFGAWMGQSEMPAMAAAWYASITDMIDYLNGYLSTQPEGDNRRAAQMLFDQLTQPQDDCQSVDDWRYGI